MAWQGIEGHDTIAQRFRISLSRNRLASTFLFVGPGGIGKRTFALKLAQALLCQTRLEAQLDPCGSCSACVQVLAQTHPDLEIISKPEGKSEIPVKLFIGEGERRMQEGLCYNISLRPFMGGRKVAIIDDADDLNEESANCLLKTLEEPPPHSTLILIGTSADKQLTTIRSRCQTIRFQPLESQIVAELLVSRGLVSDASHAQRLADYCNGSLQRAVELANEELWIFRRRLLEELSRPKLESVSLAKQICAFVDEAGKEAGARRRRARQIVGFVLDFYRQLLRAHSGLAISGDAEIGRAVREVIQNGRSRHALAGDRIDRSLEALGELDRNLNQATLIECWLDDLARLTVSHQRPQPTGRAASSRGQ